MNIMQTTLAAAIVALSITPALAEEYEVAPIGTKGSYIGCMAANSTTGVTFVAVENNLSVMMTAKGFKVSKGDVVDGTWSVDGSKERALSAKADGNGTVSVDLVANKATIDMFGDGNELSSTVGKNTMVFDLSGTKQALSELGECMDRVAKK